VLHDFGAAGHSGRRRGFVRITDHEATLWAIARRLCGNDSDAEDLVHDTYERALRAGAHYQDRNKLRGWLVTILHNLFVDRCRTAKRARVAAVDVLELAAPEPGAPPAWACVSDVEITCAMARLGPKFRRVYDLHVAGRSYDEIAAELAIAKATVGTRLIRARQKLRDAILDGRCSTGA
jgi:RNA polymerase sigma-70 factor (ECF subfamily)